MGSPDYKSLYTQCKRNVALFFGHVQSQMSRILKEHHDEKQSLLRQIANLKSSTKTIQKSFDFDPSQTNDPSSISKPFTRISLDSRFARATHSSKSSPFCQNILQETKCPPKAYDHANDKKEVPARSKEQTKKQFIRQQFKQSVVNKQNKRCSVSQPKQVEDAKNMLKSMRTHMTEHNRYMMQNKGKHLHSFKENSLGQKWIIPRVKMV